VHQYGNILVLKPKKVDGCCAKIKPQCVIVLLSQVRQLLVTFGMLVRAGVWLNINGVNVYFIQKGSFGAGGSDACFLCNSGSRVLHTG